MNQLSDKNKPLNKLTTRTLYFVFFGNVLYKFIFFFKTFGRKTKEINSMIKMETAVRYIKISKAGNVSNDFKIKLKNPQMVKAEITAK